MSLIIGTGSNLGNREENLFNAKNFLEKTLTLEAESNIYQSTAVDFLEQPDFLNQVLEFKLPQESPTNILELILSIEKKMGRVRTLVKGPRIIDLDILFWDLENIKTDKLFIPHPRWQERSFVVHPLKELPFYQKLSSKINIPTAFTHQAFPIKRTFHV